MRVFIDANIVLDIYDTTRKYHKYSIETFDYLINNKHHIFTSCNLVTTIYDIGAKKDKYKALKNIQLLSKILKVIEFSNDEIEEACNLMIEDKDYKDLEYTLQYVLANKLKCNYIISNDENFVSKDIKILSSKEFIDMVSEID